MAHTIRIDGIENVLARNGVLIFAIVAAKTIHLFATRGWATRSEAGQPVMEPTPARTE